MRVVATCLRLLPARSAAWRRLGGPCSAESSIRLVGRALCGRVGNGGTGITGSSCSGSGSSRTATLCRAYSSSPMDGLNSDGLPSGSAFLMEEGPENLHPALQLISERAKDLSSTPGRRSDGFKLGLVVEGGGMRGAVSGGMLVQLHDMGLRRVFDAVYGSSAGAINLTYFLAGQREGVDVYPDQLSNKNFIDLSRLWRRSSGRAVLDLGFLLEYVMCDIVPLNWEAVIHNEIPLKAVASCLNTLQPVMLEGFHDTKDLITCLRASANVPGIAGAPVNHRGHSLVDAAIFEPIPFPMAIRDGCTHVLVLCSRPNPQQIEVNPFMAPIQRAAEELVRKALLNPPYMRPAWSTRFEQESTIGMSVDDVLSLSMDEGAHELPFYGGAHVFPVYPDAGPASFAPLCVDPETIRRGIEEGKDVVRRTLKGVL